MHVPSGVNEHYTSSPLPMSSMTSRRYRTAEDLLRCRRQKFEMSQTLNMGYRIHPTTVARRNERERNRVKHINSTFLTLRQHLPCSTKSRKLSKVDTLRSAIRYIQHLQTILDTQEDDGKNQKENITASTRDDVTKDTPASPAPSASSCSTTDAQEPLVSPQGSHTSVDTSHGSEGRREPLSPIPFSPVSDTSSSMSSSLDDTPPSQDLAEIADWFL